MPPASRSRSSASAAAFRAAATIRRALALLRDGVDAIGPVPPIAGTSRRSTTPTPTRRARSQRAAGGFLATSTASIRRSSASRPARRREWTRSSACCSRSLGGARARGPGADRLERSATGVYVGMCSSDYAYLQLETRDRALLDAHFASGIAHSVASGRLSYLLGLQGPSLTIDTACSSSLVAVHLACQALRTGDCRMALAGGVNLILSPDLYIALSHSRMLCARRPLQDLRRRRRRLRARRRLRRRRAQAAERRTGRRRPHPRRDPRQRRQPGRREQRPHGAERPGAGSRDSRGACASRRSPRAIVSYVEAHGTGTQLGDPLEVHALGAVFGEDRPADRPLLVGSVKTNVGHLEAAAGVAGLIKIVLALQHRAIPAHLHFACRPRTSPGTTCRLRRADRADAVAAD